MGILFINSDTEEVGMTKPLKQKKNKVPKITEEQYTAYLTSLKARDHASEPINGIEKEETKEG